MHVLLCMVSIIFTILIGISVNPIVYGIEYEDQFLIYLGLEEISSHIIAANSNYAEKRFDLTIEHLSHPILDVYEKLPLTSIQDRNFTQKLELSLFILKNTHPDIDYDDYHSQISLISKILDEGKNIILSDHTIDISKLQLETAVSLLESSKMEYAEGLDVGGTINDNMEIQDSYSFTETSHDILKNLNMTSQKTNIIDNSFTELEIAYNNQASSIKINEIADKIIAEINSELTSVISNTLSDINSKEIPQWIKNIALWWATGEVSDDEFLQAVEYLINQGIIVVNNGE